MFIDGKFLTELWTLPYLIPPKGRLVLANKEVWKFSTLETIEGIFVQAKVFKNNLIYWKFTWNMAYI